MAAETCRCSRKAETKVGPGGIPILPAPVCCHSGRPPHLSSRFTLKSSCSTIKLPLHCKEQQKTRESREEEMRLHPTDTDRERLIWPATANTELGVIVSVWGGLNAASSRLGYRRILSGKECGGQGSNLHGGIRAVKVSFRFSLYSRRYCSTFGQQSGTAQANR